MMGYNFKSAKQLFDFIELNKNKVVGKTITKFYCDMDDFCQPYIFKIDNDYVWIECCENEFFVIIFDSLRQLDGILDKANQTRECFVDVVAKDFIHCGQKIKDICIKKDCNQISGVFDDVEIEIQLEDDNDFKIIADKNANLWLKSKLIDLKEEDDELAQEDKDLIYALSSAPIENNIIGILLVAKQDGVQKELAEYVKFKGQYLTESDALRYHGAVARAKGKRYQYHGHDIFVRFVKETTDELIKDDYYQVAMVFGVKEKTYLLRNEQYEMKEYPAKNFVLLRPSLVEYCGSTNPDCSHLKEGECYEVVGKENGCYVLKDGTKLMFANPVEFVDDEPKPKRKLDKKGFLNLLRGMLEFGEMSHIYERLTDDTIYISHGKNLEIKGKNNIYDYTEQISKNRVETNAMSDVVNATVTADSDCFNCKAGESFLMCFHNDDTKSCAFLQDDGTFITKIELFNGWPAYKLDC